MKAGTTHRIYSTSFASVYPLYIAKVEKKGRTQAEVDEVICWLKTLVVKTSSRKETRNFFIK